MVIHKNSALCMKPKVAVLALNPPYFMSALTLFTKQAHQFRRVIFWLLSLDDNVRAS